MKVIGLAGGIGSGKTTASDYLAGKGYKILNADLIARQIMEPGEETLRQTVDCFGEEILSDDGTLDRQKLGAIVFRDEVKLKKLEDITHRTIYAIIKDGIAEARKGDYNMPFLFIDAPLIFEAGLDSLADENWLIIAGRNQRARRVAKRDNTDEEYVIDRMEAQMSDSEKMKRADYIINNRGTKEDFYNAIEKLLRMPR